MHPVLKHPEPNETLSQQVLGSPESFSEAWQLFSLYYLCLFQLLSRVVELSSLDSVENFINRKGFHLIASQLNQVQSSDKLVNVCARFVNGPRLVFPLLNSLTQLIGCLMLIRPICECSVLIICRCSMMNDDLLSAAFILPLLGSLEKCCHDLSLLSKAFSLLFQVNKFIKSIYYFSNVKQAYTVILALRFCT